MKEGLECVVLICVIRAENAVVSVTKPVYISQVTRRSMNIHYSINGFQIELQLVIVEIFQ